MTYTNRIRNTKISDDKRALTLEDLYSKYASFAGVQGFEFDDNLNTWDSAHWSSNLGVTLGNTIVQAYPSGGERPAWYDQDMPHSYVMEFTVGTVWAVYVRGNGTDSYYRIYFNGTQVHIEKVVANIVVAKSHKVLRFSQEVGLGRFKIAVRDAQFTSDSAGRTIHIAVWMNDYLLHTYVEDVLTNPPLKLAFALPAETANGLVFSDFRISNLGEIVLLSSLDPAENPIGAIQRAIEDRYLMVWMRWNGKLRAWNPKAQTSAMTVAADREMNLVVKGNIQQAFSHVRVMGAFQWVQRVDKLLVEAIGHRFKEVNNTALWNIDDCERVAIQLFIRVKEQVFQADFATIGIPFLEREDRLRIPDHNIDGSVIDYLLDTISWDWIPDTFTVNVGLRKYFYGEP